MQMGYPNDMIKKFDIASAFIHGKVSVGVLTAALN